MCEGKLWEMDLVPWGPIPALREGRAKGMRGKEGKNGSSVWKIESTECREIEERGEEKWRGSDRHSTGKSVHKNSLSSE